MSMCYTVVESRPVKEKHGPLTRHKKHKFCGPSFQRQSLFATVAKIDSSATQRRTVSPSGELTHNTTRQAVGQVPPV